MLRDRHNFLIKYIYTIVSLIIISSRLLREVSSRYHNILDISTRCCYNHYITNQISTSFMHDYDYESTWDYEISCHDYLDESVYTYDLDEEHPREHTDYQALAYAHYA